MNILYIYKMYYDNVRKQRRNGYLEVISNSVTAHKLPNNNAQENSS